MQPVHANIVWHPNQPPSLLRQVKQRDTQIVSKELGRFCPGHAQNMPRQLGR